MDFWLRPYDGNKTYQLPVKPILALCSDARTIDFVKLDNEHSYELRERRERIKTLLLRMLGWMDE